MVNSIENESELFTLLTDKGLDGCTQLDHIVQQNNLDVLMLDGVQHVIHALWEGPFYSEPIMPYMSRNSAIVHSFFKHGTKVDKEF